MIVRAIVVRMQGKRALLAEGVSLRLRVMSGFAGRPGFLAEKKSNEKKTRSAAEARRRKTILTKQHRLWRGVFAKWVRAKTAEYLRHWAFTDGTVSYLARCETEKASSRRMALGGFAWRTPDASDAMYSRRHNWFARTA